MRVKISLTSVKITILCGKLTFFVSKSFSVCVNHTLRVEITFYSFSESKSYVSKSHYECTVKNFHVKSLLLKLATVCSVVLTVSSQSKSIKSQIKP
jgi:hypothetical protein